MAGAWTTMKGQQRSARAVSNLPPPDFSARDCRKAFNIGANPGVAITDGCCSDKPRKDRSSFKHRTRLIASYAVCNAVAMRASVISTEARLEIA